MSSVSATFLHELMHFYEFRLRLACWQENQDIDGFILHESWLRAYEADLLFLEAHGLPLRERSLSELTANSGKRKKHWLTLPRNTSYQRPCRKGQRPWSLVYWQ